MNKGIAIIFFLLGIGLVPIFPLQAATTPVVISQIQLGGFSTKDEWIELYNPTEAKIDLTGWRLTRKTAGGMESNLITTFPTASITAHGYFLIANLSGYTGTTTADLGYSNTSNSIANDNTIILYADAGKTIVDKVGFGSATDRENTTTNNPPDRQSSERKPGGNLGNGQDTGNNGADFFVQTNPVIHNSQSPATPVLNVVVINEILPDPNEGASEAVELFSPTTGDLTGWTLADATGTIATITGTINRWLVITLSGAKLNNPGDVIILKNTVGVEQDRISYGDKGGAPKPSKGETLIRLPDGADTNNDAADWQITNNPTLGAANQMRSSSPPPPAGEDNGANTAAPPVAQTSSIILITEFVSDPADNETEWVELYSTASNAIDLAGWYIEDGSEARTPLTGAIAPGGYVTINNPKGSLNNAGDSIALFDPTSALIDGVSYGNWFDANPNDNAQKTTDPNSIARAWPYVDTGTDSTDFKITTTITKGAQNIITDPPPPATISALRQRLEAEQKAVDNAARISFTGQLVISELYPNPPGDDAAGEFIEVHNISPQNITLTGLTLADAAGDFTVTDQPFPIRLPPDGYVAFRRSLTKIALNNSGEERVRLENPDGSVINELSYRGSVKTGASLVRDQQGNVYWTPQPTPDASNSLTRQNLPPIAHINAPTTLTLNQPLTFDGSDSRDPDGTISSYAWQVDRKLISSEPNAIIIFTNAGDHVVTLKITDNNNESNTTTWRETIFSDLAPANQVMLAPTTNETSNVRLSELLPNPAGDDKAEWIELVNTGGVVASLSGWSLTNNAGNKPFLFTSETVPADGFLVLGRERTRLTLKNTDGELKLLDPRQTVFDSATYASAPSGHSLIRDEAGAWQWSATPTPNALNVLTLTTALTKKSDNAPLVLADLSELAELELDTSVQTQGVVMAPPNVLGKHTIYLADATRGTQIYLSKGEWPALTLGTRLEIRGVVRQSQGERRILVRATEDIKIIGTAETPQPVVVSAASLDETSEGRLVEISGQVTQKRGNAFFVDDGSDETRVYVKASTGIKQPLSSGDSVVIAGILANTSAGLRLLPRFASDIKVGAVAGARVVTLPDHTAGSNGGETFTINPSNTPDPMQKYLLAGLGVSTILFAGLWVRDKREK